MVTRDEVKKVADLAKLEFESNELDALTTELNSVLGYIDQLKELDVSAIAPLENLNEAVESPVLRKDEVRQSLSVEEALKNAPKSADNYFLVPKVLAQEVKTYVEQDIVGDEEEELL
ncbi:MAG TPA: Asp-tRNA(Asn)/Glu-tRNA(Gln) amidotransferase subunit GatC [Candidatus Kapabacteria bacterium]|jgi:aspartyl-tRNA(Asn)/glutamyl-tRNA(Gln) amidotransferase subunit C|nr:Asp-tRNA(Asn)/Glu-tRNA(Gln) amidotransferase subunit GatC [Candidatus Kapabacteria bacterium]